MKRWGAVGALAVAGALALAGCSAGGGGSEVESGTSVAVAQNSAMTTMNANTATNYATYNSNVQYLFQGPGFNYYNSDKELVKNTKFGTYKKLSDDPLTIKYTINDGVKWTDGTPVSAYDMILSWGSSISKNNDAKGVNFGSINQGSGLDAVTKFPTIGDDNRSITIKYDTPYVDWEILPTITPNISAAALWEITGIDKKTGTDAAKAVSDAFKNNNESQLTKLAKVWKTGFDITSTPKDKRVLTSYGPYKVESLTKQYVTLVPNDGYTSGPKPKVAKITVRFIADQTAQVQALQNGEVNVLYGQATSDTVQALKGLDKVESTTTPTATFEHVDLQFDTGPFAASTYGGDADKALKVRQAFFKVVPRQEMLDRLIKPIDPSAKLDDSSLFLPGQDGYDESVSKNDSDQYQKVDVDAAKQLLAEAGVSTPITVKFAYANDNPRRVGEFQLIQASAKEAGFNVTDVGKPGAEFFGANGIGSGKYDYDATVFAYQLTSSSVTQSEGNTTTGNAYNYQGYSNSKVDDLWKQAKTVTDAKDAIPLQQEIDGYLLKDASTITLFQLPDVTAWSSNISNVSDAPYSPNVFWNFWEWDVNKK
ncbi:MAG: ABC transporter family substrate-binding protein [Gordonia polyisoprenivorans]|nr:ABC transporter family substrate-binding protein [Gordonia polyisoprenivorans]